MDKVPCRVTSDWQPKGGGAPGHGEGVAGQLGWNWGGGPGPEARAALLHLSRTGGISSSGTVTQWPAPSKCSIHTGCPDGHREGQWCKGEALGLRWHGRAAGLLTQRCPQMPLLCQ